MPSALRIRLTPSEKQYLCELKANPKTPERTKKRAEALLLSDKGLRVSMIAEYLNLAYNTVRQTLYRWIIKEKEGLCDAPRSGRKPICSVADLKYVEECLEKEERTYNSRQLVKKLKQERGVEISHDRLRRILKKKEWLWKRTRNSLKGKRKEADYSQKKKELEKLKYYALEGYINLKYLDEAGFVLSSPASYSYSRKGTQKQLNQPPKRGKRLSILGILSQKKSFDYGLKLGGFESSSYLEMIDWQAEKAADNFRKTGQITVIVLDNYSVHKSQEVQKNRERWRKKGLEFFFISAYSPELNLIESEWHQLKTHEISGRMFEDEYDLAMAVIDSVENRSIRNNCICERYRFS